MTRDAMTQVSTRRTATQVSTGALTGAAAASAIAASLLASGCFHVPVKHYEPKALDIPANRIALFSAAVKEVHEAGWNVVRVDGARGVIEALTPDEGGYGVFTRERWFFRIEDGRVSASMRLEMFSTGRWHTNANVCEGYEYLRERTRLHSIALRALPPAAPADIAPSPAAALVLAMEETAAF